jgi:hypothetical protein
MYFAVWSKEVIPHIGEQPFSWLLTTIYSLSVGVNKLANLLRIRVFPCSKSLREYPM